MSPKRTDPLATARFENPPRALEVLLVYEDKATGLRGKLALDRVLCQPEVTAEGHFRAWSLDVLRNPLCQAAATRDALDADIIVISIHGDNRLAPEAETCLEQWVGHQRSRPCALAISLDEDVRPVAGSHPALRKLRSEASRNGLTVLLQFGEAPHPEMNAATADICHRAETMSPVLEQILHQPDSVRRQDINA